MERLWRVNPRRDRAQDAVLSLILQAPIVVWSRKRTPSAHRFE
jgi:hypothetical protein